MPPITYQQAGVDPQKAARILQDFGQYLQGRPKDPLLLAGLGPFAACYSLKGLKNYDDPVLVTGCDGVGTKAKLAADWGHLEGLGQDLVAMNVNDLLCVGADPVLFLDYYACGRLEERTLPALLRSIQKGCELAGCSLVGGETAEMPGLYSDADFDLAGFSIGFAERKNLLGPDRVQDGDCLVALGSSGPHSNGYSLIRKLVERLNLSSSDASPIDGESWQQVLLKPTIIYVPLLKGWKEKLHALAHLTGGGLFENLPRVLPVGVRARIQAWDFPPLFQWLQTQSGLDTQQMLETFNCGVGMIAICPSETAEDLVRHAQQHGIAAWKAGMIEALSDPKAPPQVIWQ